jgi:PKD repeat protein
MDYGIISVDIYVSNSWRSFFNTHHDPNDVYQQDDYGITNHGVVICGWKDDPSIYNGGYWICKNSWGTSFGYNGFFNIAYGCNSFGTRCTTWVTTTEWPIEDGGGEGPIPPVQHVFANFNYLPETPKLGTEIEFRDTSQGNVVLHEWDFNNDGIIDSTEENPEHTYYIEGEFPVTLTVWNSAGLHNNITYTVTVKEIWEPIAVALPEYYGGNTLRVTFEGRYSYDLDGNIVSYDWDFDDGTHSASSHPTKIFPEGDRSYDVTLTVRDNEGATGTTHCDVRIDFTVPPVTTVVYDIGHSNDWHRTTQRVTLNAEDWTGVKHTKYKLNNNPFVTYPGPFLISQEGVHTLQFYSVDVYNNVEETKVDVIYIDKTPPTLDIMLDVQEKNNWFVTPVTVTLQGDDTLSGLDKIIYKVDLSSWQTYNEMLTFTDGQYRFWAYSVDNAGNNYGSEDPMYINVDTGPPHTTCYFTGEGTEDRRFYQEVLLSLVATDHGSGVRDIYYRLDSGEFEEYTEPFIVDSLGYHLLEFYAVDNLGNQEEVRHTTFTITGTNFDIRITQPKNGFYLFGTRIFNAKSPLIFGPVTVKAQITPFDTVTNIDYVQYFIDNTPYAYDTSPPYEWTISQRLLGKHTIKVTAFTDDGNTISDMITASFLIF